MKITATNLRKCVKRSKLTVAELTRRVNVIQDVITPGRRPMTPNAIYTYYDGHTPPMIRIYAISAVLKTSPKEIFELVHDDALQAECERLATEI